MSVSYTVHDFLFPFYGLLFLLGAILIIGLWLIRWFSARKMGATVSLLLTVPLIGIYAMATVAVVPVLERTECLLTKANRYTHTTAAVVTVMEPADHAALYFVGGQMRGGICLTMDNERFYTVAHPELTVGMGLRFTYYPAQNLIVGWEEIPLEAVQENRKVFVQPQPELEKPIPQWQIRLGQVLNAVGFFGFAGLVAAKLFFHVKLELWLRIKDAGQCREVVANPYGFWSTAVSLLFFFLIGAGHAVMDGSYRPFVILIPGVCAMMIFALLRQQTRVSLKGQTLVVRRWRKESRYPVSDIRSVYWDTAPSRGPRFRCLVIQFWSGVTLSLPQEDHLGIGDLYDCLTQNDL